MSVMYSCLSCLSCQLSDALASSRFGPRTGKESCLEAAMCSPKMKQYTRLTCTAHWKSRRTACPLELLGPIIGNQVPWYMRSSFVFLLQGLHMRISNGGWSPWACTTWGALASNRRPRRQQQENTPDVIPIPSGWYFMGGCMSTHLCWGSVSQFFLLASL